MNPLQRMTLNLLVAGLVSLGSAMNNAAAGPPLICHPIEIGDAKSLPFDGKHPLDPGSKYNVAHLISDTLELLSPNMPVIVRMETIRRATLYAREHADIRLNLMIALNGRVLDAESQDKPDALAWFDAGYLAQCYDQYDMLPKTAAEKHAGFEWVRKAARLRGNDPEMSFALALMSKYVKGADGKWKPDPQHADYLRKAIDGAKEGSLLARNLSIRYGEGTKSLKELRVTYAGK